MKRKVILLNGPPGSGKDTIAEAMLKFWQYPDARPLVTSAGFKMDLPNRPDRRRVSFKSKLIDIAVIIAKKVRRCDWDHRYTDRKLKEQPWNKLPLIKESGEHHSQRSWLIYVSEDIIKPTMGQSYLGDAALLEVLSIQEQVTIFSDSGFEGEILPFIEVPRDEMDIFLIRLYRKGCTFEGDSRYYLRTRNRYNLTFDLHNNGTVEEAVNDIKLMCGVE